MRGVAGTGLGSDDHGHDLARVVDEPAEERGHRVDRRRGRRADAAIVDRDPVARLHRPEVGRRVAHRPRDLAGADARRRFGERGDVGDEIGVGVVADERGERFDDARRRNHLDAASR